MKATGYIRIVFILVIAAVAPVLAQEGDAAHFRLSILMDRMHFYSDEKVPVRLCVKNISDEQRDFSIYEKAGAKAPGYTTFQPVVFDNRGREAATKIPYRLAGRPLSEVVNDLEIRVIRLAPGEIFTTIIDLNELYEIVPIRDYRLRAFFYPDIRKKSVIEGENQLYFRVSPARKEILKKTRAGVHRDISPSEIIHLAMLAEKNRSWETYIKYYDIGKYISSYSEFIRRYTRADAVEKVEIEEEFITFLSRKRYDYLIDFKVLKEDIEESGRAASVEVIVDRYNARRTDRYLYRYRLERYRDMWLIISLDATVMKGIKR